VDAFTEDTRTALAPVLEPHEEVAAVLAAIGCKLVVTDRHLILIRDGRSFRPRTGVQTWPLVPTLVVRSTPTDAHPGRILITMHGRTTSVFVGPHDHRAADQLIAEVRRRTHVKD
jgi:hypothetical protein